MQALANIHRLFVGSRWIGAYLHDLGARWQQSKSARQHPIKLSQSNGFSQNCCDNPQITVINRCFIYAKGGFRWPAPILKRCR